MVTGEPARAGGNVVRVVPDVTGLRRAFDYALPSRLAGTVRVGTIVRVPLQGRRVRGWVVEMATTPPAAVALKEVGEVVSAGPSPEAVEIARFAAWRYAGHLRPFLLAGSPPRRVDPEATPPRPGGVAAGVPLVTRRPSAGAGASSATREAVVAALRAGGAVVRLPPAAPRLPVVEEVLARVGGRGSVLVVVPSARDAGRLAAVLARGGAPVALLPEGWAEAARGAPVVVGTRDAAFGPVSDLAAAIVLDAHAEALVETRAPTWRADVVVAERARRAGAPCVLVTACPTPEQAVAATVVALPRDEERAGWASLVVVDRRRDDPRSGLYAEGLGGLVREAHADDPGRPVILVLNRTGRARLLACSSCGELARCEACGRSLAEATAAARALACSSCGSSRPRLCARCGSTRLRVLRVGTARAAEELAALCGLEVAEVSGPRRVADPMLPAAPVVVGTEAVLHRAEAASLVAFLDLDQELLAPRLNAAVRTFSMLALASRLVGGRRRRPRPGRVVVQTRLPHHEVVRAALRGDPTVVVEAELARRRALGLPPARAVALVAGRGVDDVRAALATSGAETVRADEGRLLVRAPDAARLADSLAVVASSEARVRIEVDPLGL